MMFCPDCGEMLRVYEAAADTWTATCPCCYDGTEDSSPRERLMGFGDTPEAATASWHERRNEL